MSLNDEFYDNVFELQYECDWRSVEDCEAFDIINGSVIIKSEAIIDGENICGVVLYLKKQGKKIVITINSPYYVNTDEKGLDFNIISE